MYIVALAKATRYNDNFYPATPELFMLTPVQHTPNR